MTSLRNVFQLEQIPQTQNKTRQKKHYLLGTRLPHDTDWKLLLNDFPQKRWLRVVAAAAAVIVVSRRRQSCCSIEMRNY
jgi:hypothetical protein